MRSLNFIAVRQNLQKDPTSDFSGLVRGSKGYLQAHFSFDAEWTGCGKVAVFTRLGKEYPARLSADTCIIPVQDYLELPKEARINTPSTLGGNWQWRMGRDALDDKLCEKIRNLTSLYGRL